MVHSVPSQKFYERLIYNRIQPVLPKEQAGFRPNRCTIDQVALLTEDIEASFDKKLKSGVVLVDLSATYDTVWNRGLTLKLLRTNEQGDCESRRGLLPILCGIEPADIRRDKSILNLHKRALVDTHIFSPNSHLSTC